LCQEHHGRRLSVFGSAVRDDFDPESSDIDFLVEFDPVPMIHLARNYFSLANALTDLLGRKVDLVEPAAIKNLFLKNSVDLSQELLYAA